MATTTETRTVTIKGGHSSHSPYRHKWAEPVGWTPMIPTAFDGENVELIDGTLWGEHEEEAGIVYFGTIEEGETKEVALSDLSWVRSGQYQNLGLVEVA